jgi:hypothetical protein
LLSFVFVFVFCFAFAFVFVFALRLLFVFAFASRIRIHLRLPIHHCYSHDHSFTKSVIDSLVIDNMNPVSRVERSALIVAAVVHKQNASCVVADGSRARVAAESPLSLLEDDGGGDEADAAGNGAVAESVMADI